MPGSEFSYDIRFVSQSIVHILHIQSDYVKRPSYWYVDENSYTIQNVLTGNLNVLVSQVPQRTSILLAVVL